jgi:hypothetical protein
MAWLLVGLSTVGGAATSAMRSPRLTPIALVTALSMLAVPVAAHVRLTYPPAFGPSDFLDNARTPAPCGGTAPEGTVATVVQAGEPMEVQWSLGYAHYGGHALQVINTTYDASQDAATSNCGYKILANLSSEWLVDAGAENDVVTIPTGLGCGPGSTCALRLLRSAREWGDPELSFDSPLGYRFWSCSMVEIVDSPASAGTGQTAADDAAWGSCTEDSDCGANGRCVDVHNRESARLP